MEKRLFVGNLPYSVGESELEAAFAEHGTVVSSVVIRDRESGRSRGFGFIEMETEEMAESAAAIEAALSMEVTQVEDAARRIVQADRVFLTGMGTAYHMAMFEDAPAHRPGWWILHSTTFAIPP